MLFEAGAVFRQQARPIQPVRDHRRLVPWRLGSLVRHLEEEQEGDLLRVLHVRQAVVPEQVRRAPRLVDDALGVVVGQETGSSSWPVGSVVPARRVEVHPVRAHPVDEPMFLVDPPGPSACKLSAEGFGFPDASERVATNRVH